MDYYGFSDRQGSHRDWEKERVIESETGIQQLGYFVISYEMLLILLPIYAKH